MKMISVFSFLPRFLWGSVAFPPVTSFAQGVLWAVHRHMATEGEETKHGERKTNMLPIFLIARGHYVKNMAKIWLVCNFSRAEPFYGWSIVIAPQARLVLRSWVCKVRSAAKNHCTCNFKPYLSEKFAFWQTGYDQLFSTTSVHLVSGKGWAPGRVQTEQDPVASEGGGGNCSSTAAKGLQVIYSKWTSEQRGYRCQPL